MCIRDSVRLAEFKTYIKELGYGSKKVKKGLFAKVMSENKESDSKIGFFKKVVLPIRDAEVLDILIGEPVSAKSFIAPSRKDNAVSYTHLRAHETVSHRVCRLLLQKIFF